MWPAMGKQSKNLKSFFKLEKNFQGLICAAVDITRGTTQVTKDNLGRAFLRFYVGMRLYSITQ